MRRGTAHLQQRSLGGVLRQRPCRPLFTWLLTAALMLGNAWPSHARASGFIPAHGNSAPAAFLLDGAAQPVVLPRPAPHVLGAKPDTRQEPDGGSGADGDTPAAVAAEPPQVSAPRAWRFIALIVTREDARPVRLRLFDPRAPPPVS